MIPDTPERKRLREAVRAYARLRHETRSAPGTEKELRADVAEKRAVTEVERAIRSGQRNGGITADDVRIARSYLSNAPARPLSGVKYVRSRGHPWTGPSLVNKRSRPRPPRSVDQLIRAAQELL